MGSGICTVISDLCNKRSPERGRLCKIIVLVNITHSPLSGARTAHSLLPRPPLTRRTGIVILLSLRLSEYAFWKCFYSCRFLTFQPGFAAAPSFASRLGWLTHYSRLCSENSCILPDRTKRKTLEIKWFSAFCGRSSDFLVIRLGPEPRTPTLKVLCSTSWASESPCFQLQGYWPVLVTWLAL